MTVLLRQQKHSLYIFQILSVHILVPLSPLLAPSLTLIYQFLVVRFEFACCYMCTIQFFFFLPAITVGFTNESVTVPEDIGSFELCVSFHALNGQQIQLSPAILVSVELETPSNPPRATFGSMYPPKVPRQGKPTVVSMTLVGFLKGKKKKR